MQGKTPFQTQPYLLGQIGLVGNKMGLVRNLFFQLKTPYLLGQIGLVGNSLRLKRLSYLYDLLPSLPIRSNRISWKHSSISLSVGSVSHSNPYLLGQIGLVGNLARSPIPPITPSSSENPPYLLGQIGLVGNLLIVFIAITESFLSSLPIRSNRISWKHQYAVKQRTQHQVASLPIRSNRISWKP
jgi:hypothetical protein